MVPIDEMVRKGCVVSFYGDETLKTIMRFSMKLFVIDPDIKITSGGLEEYMCHCHKVAFLVTISSIKDTLDRESKTNRQDNSTFLTFGDTCVVSLTPMKKVVLEKISEYPSTGRITFFDAEETKVLEQESSPK